MLFARRLDKCLQLCYNAIMPNAQYEIEADIDKAKLAIYNVLDYAQIVHFHHSIELQYVIKGTYETNICGQIYKFDSNDIVFIPPYTSHGSPACNASSILCIFQSFATADFNDIFQTHSLKYNLNDKQFNSSYIKPVIDMMMRHFEQVQSGVIDIVVKGYINIILGLLIDHYGLQQNKHDKSNDFIIDLIKFIDTNYQTDMTLESLSTRYGYSKFYFSKIFNKIVGMKLPEYINQVRVRNFMQSFMKDSNQNITNLIFACGFNSIVTFYRAFEKIYGKPPKEYFLAQFEH